MIIIFIYEIHINLIIFAIIRFWMILISYSIIDKYACLKGKQNNILVKWPSISKKLQQLIILQLVFIQDDIVYYNNVKDFDLCKRII